MTPIKERCKQGDLWALGSHRLYCADSTNPENIQRLLQTTKPDMIFADPPYGINVAKTGKLGKGTNYKPVIGDEDNSTAIKAYKLCSEMYPEATQIWWGANYYANLLPTSRCWVVWDKLNGTTSFADGELAWTNIKTSLRIFRHRWNGANKASERGQKRFHPNQKPVMLAEWFYERYGKPGDLIFDPFAGTGITLLAAQNTQRRCYACEISPEYCNVILARYEQFTCNSAHLLEHIDPS